MRKFQEAVPIVLWTVLVSLICILSYIKLSPLTGATRLGAIGMVVCYLIWLLLELRVAAREIGRGQTRLDRGTLELYALGRAATVLSALGLEGPSRWVWFMMALGGGIFLMGVGLRLCAIRMLGELYSHRVRLTPDQKIVHTGPYRFIRHPAYAGMLLAHLGFVLFFFNWVSAGVLLLFFTPAVVLRILVEEKVLLTLNGYSKYSVGRKRLIPALW